MAAWGLRVEVPIRKGSGSGRVRMGMGIRIRVVAWLQGPGGDVVDCEFGEDVFVVIVCAWATVVS